MSTARLARVAIALAERDLESFLTTDPANLFYLSGFTGSNGLVHVAVSGEARFLTDFRYETQAAEQLGGDFTVEVVAGELLDELAPTLSGAVGFEDDKLSARAVGRLEEMIGDASLVAAGGLVEGLRTVKDVGEVERIRAAAALIDDVFEWLAAGPVIGRTERELAVAVEAEMRARGAAGPSFPSIVAHGEHGALPHATPRDVPIERGRLVTVDMGAVLDAYCSDCTRTFAAGTPTQHAQEIYELVAKAQLTGLQALRPGRSGREVDAQARAVIEDAGLGEHFGHGLGHGVGIEIHEAPRLARRASDDPLEAGSVVTVEPGVYLPGELGIRIEDLVVVREDGPEILSIFTKELLEVG